jgi:hypothetical protein
MCTIVLQCSTEVYLPCKVTACTPLVIGLADVPVHVTFSTCADPVTGKAFEAALAAISTRSCMSCLACHQATGELCGMHKCNNINFDCACWHRMHLNSTWSPGCTCTCMLLVHGPRAAQHG